MVARVVSAIDQKYAILLQRFQALTGEVQAVRNHPTPDSIANPNQLRRMTVEHVQSLLQSGDRTQAGPTAPAHGLTLRRVDYGPRTGY